MFSLLISALCVCLSVEVWFGFNVCLVIVLKFLVVGLLTLCLSVCCFGFDLCCLCFGFNLLVVFVLLMIMFSGVMIICDYFVRLLYCRLCLFFVLLSPVGFIVIGLLLIVTLLILDY